MKPKKIADNPLSKNLADLLGYYDKDPQDTKEIIERVKKISKNIQKKLDVKVSPVTIFSWIDPREEDPTRALKLPSLESLIPFAQIMCIKNFWDLFVPKNYLNLSILPDKKQQLIRFIINVEDKDIDDITEAVATTTRKLIEEIIEEKNSTQEKYSKLLNLLNVQS